MGARSPRLSDKMCIRDRAKLTVLPDGSAWLEALRVAPFAQGKGVGKQFYQHFFTVARERGIPSMRMYTGVRNAVSKGLAERFGFRLAATYRGASREEMCIRDRV